MSEANPEVMVLWRGETAIRILLEKAGGSFPLEERYALQELLPELERIRLLRVARWNQRKRAKQAKRRAAVQQRDAYDRVALDVLRRSASRDHSNGDTQ